jgi:hypothetical protein
MGHLEPLAGSRDHDEGGQWINFPDGVRFVDRRGWSRIARFQMRRERPGRRQGPGASNGSVMSAEPGEAHRSISTKSLYIKAQGRERVDKCSRGLGGRRTGRSAGLTVWSRAGWAHAVLHDRINPAPFSSRGCPGSRSQAEAERDEVEEPGAN